MSAFLMNVLRHNKINDALEPHGLVLSRGCIIDKTLPPYIHSFVCRFDQNGGGDDENPLNHFEVSAYLAHGRKARIDTFQAEQAEARAWSNREISRG